MNLVWMYGAGIYGLAIRPGICFLNTHEGNGVTDPKINHND